MSDKPTYTIEEFAQWLEQQDANEQYCYTSSAGCAVALFLREKLNLNYKDHLVIDCTQGYAEDEHRNKLASFDIRMDNAACICHPRTFGALRQLIQQEHGA